ncbi:glycosyltransferase family A protein, partial [Salinisphaera sp.]|uniref:glycosyltransferase family 2 protein n=1 Tax=Salinisphaera sp. TaxID=1914330 RepID=UPI002D793787
IEGYIAACLDSLLANQREDFEVIVVNDGSTDATARIIDGYDHDPRFHSVHQNNAGLGAARNSGIEQARGRFILFVDGDDWLSDGALDTCLDAIDAAPDADLFVFDYFDVDDKHKVRQFCGPGFWTCRNAAWNKVYARSLIGDRRFDTDIFYEDMARVRPWVARAEQIERIDGALYNYRNCRSGSIMNSSDTHRFFELLTAASRCVDRIEADFAHEPSLLGQRLGADWKSRFYTTDVFVPALVGWPRKLPSARERRAFASEFFSRLPANVPDKRLLARDFSYKIAIAAACYERGAFASGDWLLHRLGRLKRRFSGGVG